jgi:hypothetical protein
MNKIGDGVILDGVQSSVVSLYEEGSVGSVCGLSIVIILPCFQMLGIKQWACVL